MLNAAAVITVSVGLSVVVCLIVSLAIVTLLRLRRAHILRTNRDQRIYQAIWGGSYGQSSGLEATGARRNETDGYATVHQLYDVENDNSQSQSKDRWGSLRNNIPLPRQPTLRNIRKAIISGCLSPLSTIIQKSRAWYQASIAPAIVAELPSDITPRNTFENQQNDVSTGSNGRESSATYAQSLRTKASSKSPTANPPNQDTCGRESPLPGPPPPRPLPPLPSTESPSHSDPPGRRSTSHGSALSSKTTGTSILDVSANFPPRRSIDLQGRPASSSFHSFKVQGRRSGMSSDVSRSQVHQRGKLSRYASLTSPKLRYSGWEQYASRTSMSRASTGRSHNRISYTSVPTDYPVDEMGAFHPSTIPARVDENEKRDLERNIPSRCESCRAITPEPWGRSHEDTEPNSLSRETCPTTPSRTQPQESSRLHVKKSEVKLKDQPKPSSTLSALAPSARSSRIPSPAPPLKQVQEGWPILPAPLDPNRCKSSIELSRTTDTVGSPPAVTLTPSQPRSTPDLYGLAKRAEDNASRSEPLERSQGTQTPMSAFSELTSLFHHQSRDVSAQPRITSSEEPFPLDENDSSYPPNVYWPPIKSISPSRSVDDLRKSIMKLRRMNSEASERTKSLCLHLQCDELPHSTVNTENLRNNRGKCNSADITPGDGDTNDKNNAKGDKNAASGSNLRKNSNIRSCKAAARSGWEDASLSISHGTTSYIPGRVSLECSPRNKKGNRDSVSHDMESPSKDGSDPVAPGSLYDRNGFLKE